jgi:hypothetical protein
MDTPLGGIDARVNVSPARIDGVRAPIPA